MDNASLSICLDLVTWFESVCQAIPNFELTRQSFYLNGKIMHVASPGVIRVISSLTTVYL